MVPPGLTPLSLNEIQDIDEESLDKPSDELLDFCRRINFPGWLGRCLDVTVLEPADILLFASDDEPISQLIQNFQTALGYDAEFARFVHAALYLGEDRICHARVNLAPIQRGIRIESIFEYNPYSFLPMAALRVPNIPDADRVRVALAAACKTGLRYDFTGAFDLCRGFLNLRFPRIFYEPDQRSEISNAHICSELIENAYDEVWPGKDVLGTSDGTALLTLPADIAKSTKLLPVEIPVCRID